MKSRDVLLALALYAVPKSMRAAVILSAPSGDVPCASSGLAHLVYLPLMSLFQLHLPVSPSFIVSGSCVTINKTDKIQ